MNRKITIFLICLLAANLSAFAETLKLKSGQEVQGQIIERSDKEIKLDFMGVVLTYFLDEVEGIDGVPLETSAQEASPNAQITAEDFFYLGVSNAKKGNIDESISNFSKAIELNPKLSQSYYNRGLGFIKKKNYDFAIDDFNKAIEINPKYSEAYNNRSVAYFMKQEYEKALQDAQKAEESGYKVNQKFIEQLRNSINEIEK